jgi:ubiquinone/menaquinone biosynthesis C-methylase UbiE
MLLRRIGRGSVQEKPVSFQYPILEDGIPLKNELAGWLQSDGESLLRGIGLRGGQTVLDFGCGSGNYAIPAARIVGRKGKVYALDKKSRGMWPGEGLVELKSRAESWGFSNIEAVKTSGELELGLGEESVDFVILYDVLHDYYFPDASERENLLSELHRVLKPEGILSFYPGDPELAGNSRELEVLIREIQHSGFRLVKRYECRLLHENKPTLGMIRNFAKTS